MLYSITINSKSDNAMMYYCTLNLYKNQEDLDADKLEEIDRTKRAKSWETMVFSYEELMGKSQEEMIQYIKTRGEELFNSQPIQDKIKQLEGVPQMETPTTIIL